ncbi:hypothetical protein CU097_002318, partial [Rhizopus azygosporus]
VNIEKPVGICHFEQWCCGYDYAAKFSSHVMTSRVHSSNLSGTLLTTHPSNDTPNLCL